nr:hypothetical protein [Deltaproteobacteria bacterium]
MHRAGERFEQQNAHRVEVRGNRRLDGLLGQLGGKGVPDLHGDTRPQGTEARENAEPADAHLEVSEAVARHADAPRGEAAMHHPSAP